MLCENIEQCQWCYGALWNSTHQFSGSWQCLSTTLWILSDQKEWSPFPETLTKCTWRCIKMPWSAASKATSGVQQNIKKIPLWKSLGEDHSARLPSHNWDARLGKIKESWTIQRCLLSQAIYPFTRSAMNYHEIQGTLQYRVPDILYASQYEAYFRPFKWERKRPT